MKKVVEKIDSMSISNWKAALNRFVIEIEE